MTLLVHEVAQEAEVSGDTVRKNERLGLITAQRDENGWRRFPREAVIILRRRYGKDVKATDAVGA